MRVGVYLNSKYYSHNESFVERIFKAFEEQNCISVKSFDDLDGLDVLFVLGGDGTILNVASACAERKVKIIGINYGNLGFLAEFEPDKLNDAINLVLSGKYLTQKRSMFDVFVGDKCFSALNDLVIQRNTGGENFRNTVNLHAEIDGTTVDNFSSDGVIVSTPTGSTAYSLAAGGSVLTPDLNAFILTPICPHSLHSRPVVFGDSSVLKISPLNTSAPLGLIVDGKVVGEIKCSETVTVKKSENYAEFITENDKDFFKKLLIKLNIWSK